MNRKINRAKRVSRQCRNNGQCPWCRSSRLHGANVRKQAAREQVVNGLDEYYGEIEDSWTNYGITRCDEARND